MHRPGFTIQACTPSDIPQMIEVYLSAFSTDPFTPYVFPKGSITPSELNSWLTKRFTKQFEKRWVRVTKIIEIETGSMAAFLRYQVPHIMTDEEKASEEQEKQEREELKKVGRDPMWPVGANLELIEAKFGRIRALNEKYVDPAEFYVAHLLATHPSYQRRGLASLLLREMLDQADADGRKAYIEATDAGYPCYTKLGWRDLDVVEVDLRKYGGNSTARNRILIREPAVAERAGEQSAVAAAEVEEAEGERTAVVQGVEGKKEEEGVITVDVKTVEKTGEVDKVGQV